MGYDRSRTRSGSDSVRLADLAQLFTASTRAPETPRRPLEGFAPTFDTTSRIQRGRARGRAEEEQAAHSSHRSEPPTYEWSLTSERLQWYTPFHSGFVRVEPPAWQVELRVQRAPTASMTHTARRNRRPSIRSRPRVTYRPFRSRCIRSADRGDAAAPRTGMGPMCSAHVR